MRKIYKESLINKQFTKLTVIDEEFDKTTSRTMSICKCSCGKIIKVRNMYLIKGLTKSCGCYSKELFPKNVRKHGLTKHYLYPTWCRMKQRCYDKNDKSYINYGKRGIKICERWLKGDSINHGFECFLKDMGDKPEGYSIDRIDFNGNYCKENCRWCSPQEQSDNKRTSIQTYNKLLKEIEDLKTQILKMEEIIDVKFKIHSII